MRPFVALCTLVAWVGATDTEYSHRWYCTQRGVVGDVDIFQYTCDEQAKVDVALCCRCNIGECDDVNHPCRPSTHRVNPEMCEHIANPTPPLPAVSGPKDAHKGWLQRRKHRHLHRRKYSNENQAELERRRAQGGSGMPPIGGQGPPPNGQGGPPPNGQGGPPPNGGGSPPVGGGGGNLPPFGNGNGGGRITAAPMTGWHRQAIPGGGVVGPVVAPDFDAPPTPPPRVHNNGNWSPPNGNGGGGQQQPPNQASPNASPPQSGGWQSTQQAGSQQTVWGNFPMGPAIPQAAATPAPADSQFIPPAAILGPPTYCCGQTDGRGNCPLASQPDKFYCCNVNPQGGPSPFAPNPGVTGQCPNVCRERQIVWTQAPDRHRWCVCAMCGADSMWATTAPPIRITPNRPGWCLLRQANNFLGAPKKWQRCRVGPSGKCTMDARRNIETCHMCKSRTTGVAIVKHCWNQPQKDINYASRRPLLPGAARSSTSQQASSGMGGGTIFLIVLLVLMGMGAIGYYINEQTNGKMMEKLYSQNSTNVMTGGDNETGFFAL